MLASFTIFHFVIAVVIARFLFRCFRDFGVARLFCYLRFLHSFTRLLGRNALILTGTSSAGSSAFLSLISSLFGITAIIVADGLFAVLTNLLGI